MLKALVGTSLLAATASANPATPAPPLHAMRPPDPTPCLTRGPILFRSEVRALPGFEKTDLPRPNITLYETGGWTFDELRGDALKRTATGCLSDDRMAELRADLDTTSGKLVWTELTCGSLALDAKSRAQLIAIDTILEDATKPVTPPCCKK